MISDDNPQEQDKTLGQPFKPKQPPAGFTGYIDFASMPPVLETLSARESGIEALAVDKRAVDGIITASIDEKALMASTPPEPTAAPAVTWSWGCTLEPSAALVAYYASLPPHMPGRTIPVISLD